MDFIFYEYIHTHTLTHIYCTDLNHHPTNTTPTARDSCWRCDVDTRLVFGSFVFVWCIYRRIFIMAPKRYRCIICCAGERVRSINWQRVHHKQTPQPNTIAYTPPLSVVVCACAHFAQSSRNTKPERRKCNATRRNYRSYSRNQIIHVMIRLS